jgi:hypothetical protein
MKGIGSSQETRVNFVGRRRGQVCPQLIKLTLLAPNITVADISYENRIEVVCRRVEKVQFTEQEGVIATPRELYWEADVFHFHLQLVSTEVSRYAAPAICTA